MSVERVLVADAVHARFVALVDEELARVRMGSSGEDDIGPMVTADQRAIVERHVDDARALGATVVRGGSRPALEGCFYAPTLITGVTEAMEIYREETFGPVAPIIIYDDVDEVIDLANDTNYGLAAYVYTKDLSTAIRAMEGLRFGIIGINDVNPTSAAAPFGGINDSGLGREGGHEGIAEYLETKLAGIAL